MLYSYFIANGMGLCLWPSVGHVRQVKDNESGEFSSTTFGGLLQRIDYRK